MSYAKRNAERVIALVDSLGPLSELPSQQLTELYYHVAMIDAEIGTAFLLGEPYDETCKKINSIKIQISEILWS